MKRCTECNKEINAEEGSTYKGKFPKCRDCFSSNRSHRSGVRTQGNANDEAFVELDNHEIVHFLQDMDLNLQWFLDKAAEHHKRTGSKNEKLNLTGEEDNSETKSLISVGNNKFHKLFRTKIPWDSEDRKILQTQIGKCSCKQGRIHIFKVYRKKKRCKYDQTCRTLDCPSQHPLCQYRKETYPNFSIGDRGKVMNNAVIAPYYKDTVDGVDVVYLFNIFELSEKKKHWAFVGGDVKFSEDDTLYDSSVREWKEECGLLLEYPFDKAFNLNRSHFENWEISEGELASNSGAYFTGSFLLVHASEEFYNETKNGVNFLLEKNLDRFVTSTDDKVKIRKIHTEGFTYMECDKCCWISLKEYDDNIKLMGSEIRSDNVEFVRQREKHKWWKWMCNELSL